MVGGQLAVGSWQLAVGSWQLAANRRHARSRTSDLSDSDHRPPPTDHRPPTTDHRPLLIMRVIAGIYRGRNLRSPPSLQVRPTSDRLRETLFNIIAPRIDGTRFLDLCAGSGAVGIEALSRGAAHVTFVDRSRKLCGLIESNLDLCKVPEDQTEVAMADALDFLRRASERGAELWDIACFDPPYSTDYTAVLSAFGRLTLLQHEGLLIVEHHHKNEVKEEYGELRRWRIIKQGESCLSFYERA